MNELPSLCDVMVAVGSLLYILTFSSEAHASKRAKKVYLIIFLSECGCGFDKKCQSPPENTEERIDSPMRRI